MVETKYNTSHHAGGTPEARIANRLKNSGGEEAHHHAVHGTGPTRTNIRSTGNVQQRGSGNPGEGDIHGNKRGVV